MEGAMGKLDGKVCIVTGAAGAIGSATAKLFVQEGARVMLVDRDVASLAPLATELGKQASVVGADVSLVEDSQRYVAATVERFGRLDVLFANAGIGAPANTIVDLPTEAFDEVYAVNVRGVFLGLKYAIPRIAQQGGGSVVISSSIAGLRGLPSMSAYVTSKHALLGLMRTAAIEAGPQRVRVNTIHPGPIDNRLMHFLEEQLSPGDPLQIRRMLESQIPLGRYGTNEEVARLVLFLASDDAAYCTGTDFVVDGGRTSQ
jgi:NAD(P)-dependent dehydrogenase (short-subunit alcohol dehydrogenase family)